MKDLAVPPPRYEVLPDKRYKYRSITEVVYSDSVTGKTITIPAGYRSDGASGAFDIYDGAWWFHDKICDKPEFDDGTPIGAWTAARIISDILAANKRPWRSIYWRWSTFAFGCKKTRKNGWFK